MGADLICYIALGPRKISLSDRKVNKVARQVREYLDGCIAAAEQLLMGQKNVPDPWKGSRDADQSVRLCPVSSIDDTIYEQVSVKSEAVRKRIASSRLFGVVAPDAPDYRIRPGPIHNHGVP